jgi:hypothetical protein
MSDNSLPTTLPTRQAAAIPGRSARNKVTGKLRTALDLMVWSGKKRVDAAQEAQRCASRTSFRTMPGLQIIIVQPAPLPREINPTIIPV